LTSRISKRPLGHTSMASPFYSVTGPKRVFHERERLMMRGFSVACCSPQMQACAGHHVCDGECMKLAGGVWVKGSGREEGGYLLLLPVFSCLSQVQFSQVAAACFLSFFLCYLPALAERACLSSHPPISGIDRGGSVSLCLGKLA